MEPTPYSGSSSWRSTGAEMSIPAFEIGHYDDLCHRAQVVELWKEIFAHEAAHNEPGLVIDKKRSLSDGLFFVATRDGAVAGTVMAGYDGHRDGYIAWR
jgi:hypothetical protein